MFGRNKAGETPSKPVWNMNDAERLAERDARYQTYAEYFRRKGANVTMNGSLLVVGTLKNNYRIEMLPADPRIVSMEILYEVIPGDIDRASWSCYNAQARTVVAKAKAEPERDGYMLRFAVESIHGTAQSFMDVADMQMACLEDCRANYLNLMQQAIEENALAWATQPE